MGLELKLVLMGVAAVTGMNHMDKTGIQAFHDRKAVIVNETYEYDDLGRLTKIVYDDGTVVTYVYDSNGNILEVTVTPPEEKTGEESSTEDKGESGGNASTEDGEDISGTGENPLPVPPKRETNSIDTGGHTGHHSHEKEENQGGAQALNNREADTNTQKPQGSEVQNQEAVTESVSENQESNGEKQKTTIYYGGITITIAGILLLILLLIFLLRRKKRGGRP